MQPRRSSNSRRRGSTPRKFTLFSYGVVQAIAEGIKRAGSDDPKAIAKALEDGKPVETVVGPVRFDNKGDVRDPSYDINVWSAGKYAPVAN